MPDPKDIYKLKTTSVSSIEQNNLILERYAKTRGITVIQVHYIIKCMDMISSLEDNLLILHTIPEMISGTDDTSTLNFHRWAENLEYINLYVKKLMEKPTLTKARNNNPKKETEYV